MVGIGRALNSLLNDQRYNAFLMMDPTVAAFDPTYLSPLLVMIANYALLGWSTHPFLVHLRQRNLIVWNTAFMSGLLFVVLPTVIA